MSGPPSTFELLAAWSAGLALGGSAAAIATATLRRLASRRRPGPAPWRCPRGLALASLATALVAASAEVRPGGIRPGWHARVPGLGWHAGAFLDGSGFGPSAIGPGDPRVGLEVGWLTPGRSVYYLGRETRP